MNQTTIFLTDEDARLFTLYQKHYLFINLLESIGAFKLKNGSITVYFDNLGGIAKVDKQEQFRIPQP